MNNSPLTYPPPRSLSAGSGPNLNQAPAVPLTIRCRASSPQTAKLIESPSSDPDHPSGAPPPQTSAWERVLGAHPSESHTGCSCSPGPPCLEGVGHRRPARRTCGSANSERGAERARGVLRRLAGLREEGAHAEEGVKHAGVALHLGLVSWLAHARGVSLALVAPGTGLGGDDERGRQAPQVLGAQRAEVRGAQARGLPAVAGPEPVHHPGGQEVALGVLAVGARSRR